MSRLIKASRVNVPSLRHYVKLDKNSLFKSDNPILKCITEKKEAAYGRSSTGRITSWHRQRGAKRMYRTLDLSSKPRTNLVLGVSYDPNRSAYNALCFDLHRKEFNATLAVGKITAGAVIQTGPNITDLKLGNRTQLSNIPAGTVINNILLPGREKSTYARAAGSFAELIQKTADKARVKLSSKKVVELPITSYATLGVVGNENWNLTVKGKAGRNRLLGRRPIVRGIAMNPVDHPHGGRTNGGRPWVTPWGLPCKSGFKLRKKKKANN